MAKLSALVIPAVIDTSGVDKGISQIRNKLSRVRGQGGIGQGGNGFSSGITPQGGHLPSVGSPIGSAMAAAFGASVGARASGFGGSFAAGKAEVWSGVPKGAKNWANRNGLTRRSTQAYYEMRVANADFKNEPWNWEALDSAQQAQTRYFKTLGRQQQLMRSVSRGMAKRGMFRELKGVGQAIGFPSIGKIGLGGAGLAATGVLGTINKVGQMAGSRSVEGMFGDLSRWQGSDQYQAALALHQRSYDRRATPGFWESAMLADQQNAMRRGKKEGGLSKFGQMWDTVTGAAGSALAGLFDSPTDYIANEARARGEKPLFERSDAAQIRANNSLKQALNH